MNDFVSIHMANGDLGKILGTGDDRIDARDYEVLKQYTKSTKEGGRAENEQMAMAAKKLLFRLGTYTNQLAPRLFVYVDPSRGRLELSAQPDKTRCREVSIDGDVLARMRRESRLAEMGLDLGRHDGLRKILERGGTIDGPMMERVIKRIKERGDRKEEDFVMYLYNSSFEDSGRPKYERELSYSPWSDSVRLFYGRPIVMRDGRVLGTVKVKLTDAALDVLGGYAGEVSERRYEEMDRPPSYDVRWEDKRDLVVVFGGEETDLTWKHGAIAAASAALLAFSAWKGRKAVKGAVTGLVAGGVWALKTIGKAVKPGTIRGVVKGVERFFGGVQRFRTGTILGPNGKLIPNPSRTRWPGVIINRLVKWCGLPAATVIVGREPVRAAFGIEKGEDAIPIGETGIDQLNPILTAMGEKDAGWVDAGLGIAPAIAFWLAKKLAKKFPSIGTQVAGSATLSGLAYLLGVPFAMATIDVVFGLGDGLVSGGNEEELLERGYEVEAQYQGLIAKGVDGGDSGRVGMMGDDELTRLFHFRGDRYPEEYDEMVYDRKMDTLPDWSHYGWILGLVAFEFEMVGDWLTPSIYHRVARTDIASGALYRHFHNQEVRTRLGSIFVSERERLALEMKARDPKSTGPTQDQIAERVLLRPDVQLMIGHLIENPTEYNDSLKASNIPNISGLEARAFDWDDMGDTTVTVKAQGMVRDPRTGEEKPGEVPQEKSVQVWRYKVRDKGAFAKWLDILPVADPFPVSSSALAERGVDVVPALRCASSQAHLLLKKERGSDPSPGEVEVESSSRHLSIGDLMTLAGLLDKVDKKVFEENSAEAQLMRDARAATSAAIDRLYMLARYDPVALDATGGRPEGLADRVGDIQERSLDLFWVTGVDIVPVVDLISTPAQDPQTGQPVLRKVQGGLAGWAMRKKDRTLDLKTIYPVSRDAMAGFIARHPELTTHGLFFRTTFGDRRERFDVDGELESVRVRHDEARSLSDARIEAIVAEHGEKNGEILQACEAAFPDNSDAVCALEPYVRMNLAGTEGGAGAAGRRMAIREGLEESRLYVAGGESSRAEHVENFWLAAFILGLAEKGALKDIPEETVKEWDKKGMVKQEEDVYRPNMDDPTVKAASEYLKGLKKREDVIRLTVARVNQIPYLPGRPGDYTGDEQGLVYDSVWQAAHNTMSEDAKRAGGREGAALQRRIEALETGNYTNAGLDRYYDYLERQNVQLGNGRTASRVEVTNVQFEIRIQEKIDEEMIEICGSHQGEIEGELTRELERQFGGKLKGDVDMSPRVFEAGLKLMRQVARGEIKEEALKPEESMTLQIVGAAMQKIIKIAVRENQDGPIATYMVPMQEIAELRTSVTTGYAPELVPSTQPQSEE